MPDILATMSQGCYEETVSVEFKLNQATNDMCMVRLKLHLIMHVKIDHVSKTTPIIPLARLDISLCTKFDSSIFSHS